MRRRKIVSNFFFTSRSDGFYRRQLVLTKEKPVDRVDNPNLDEKMKAEIESIFLWAFAGLQRLVANNFEFTESQRTRENRETVKRDNNNVFDFLESEGYIQLKADASISSTNCCTQTPQFQRCADGRLRIFCQLLYSCQVAVGSCSIVVV